MAYTNQSLNLSSSGGHNRIMPSREEDPYQYQNYPNNAPIFENHSLYRSTYQPGIDRNYYQSNERTQQHFPRYAWNDPQNSISNRNNFIRHSVSVQENDFSQYRNNQENNRMPQHEHHPRHTHPHIPHSISLDSWQNEQVHSQYRRLANLHLYIESLSNELVECEHQALTKEEQYRTCLKVAKNPTEEDCILLESENAELQHKLQLLYDECDRMKIDMPGDSPTINDQPAQRISSRPKQKSPHMQHHHYENTWIYGSPQQGQEPPSKNILMNPDDNSLTTPMADWM